MVAGFIGIENRFNQANPTLLNKAFALANNILLGGATQSGTMDVLGGANGYYYFTAYAPCNMNITGCFAETTGGTANVTILNNGAPVTAFNNLVANTSGTGLVATVDNTGVVNLGNTIQGFISVSGIGSSNSVIATIIVSGVGTGPQIASAAFTTANAAYGAANVANGAVIQGIYATANAAYNQANIASALIYSAEIIYLTTTSQAISNTRWPLFYYTPTNITVSNVGAIWVANASTTGDGLGNAFVTFQQGPLGAFSGINISGQMNVNTVGSGANTLLSNTLIQQGNTVYILVANVSPAKPNGTLVIQMTYSFAG